MSTLGYYPGEDKHNNVFSFLERNLKNNPDLTLFKWVAHADLEAWRANPKADPLLRHQHISLADFSIRVRRVAEGYKEIGIQKNDCVVIFLPMSIDMYAAMFGLQMIGAIPVFLDTWARRGHLGVVARVVQPKAMVSLPQAFELIAGLEEFKMMKHEIVWGGQPQKHQIPFQQLLNHNHLGEAVPVHQEHTALVTFTTGSSGEPKGANRSHRFLAAQHYAINSSMPYETTDVDLPAFPVFSLNNIAAGVQTVIPAIDVGTPHANDALLLHSQIQACGINCMTLSPSILNGLSNYCLKNNINLLNLKRVAAGGAAISKDNVLDFSRVAPQADLLILYGSTEVEPIAHLHKDDMLTKKSRSQSDELWVDDGVYVGHFTKGLRSKIIKIEKGPIVVQENWADWELAEGQCGELIVAGEHVCPGYFNNEAAFGKAKIKDTSGTIWHRTGDVCRLEGHDLWLVGRIHNVIRRGHEYYFPVRPEILLKRIQHVLHPAYMGLPHNELGEKCVVAVSLKNQEWEETLKEIKNLFKHNQIHIDEIYWVSQIPLDPRHHSKVEYEALRQSILEKNYLKKVSFL